MKYDCLSRRSPLWRRRSSGLSLTSQGLQEEKPPRVCLGRPARSPVCRTEGLSGGSIDGKTREEWKAKILKCLSFDLLLLWHSHVTEQAIQKQGGQCVAFLQGLPPPGNWASWVRLEGPWHTLTIPRCSCVFGFQFEIEHEAWEVPGRGWVAAGFQRALTACFCASRVSLWLMISHWVSHSGGLALGKGMVVTSPHDRSSSWFLLK